jgi:filamentous hemagglutinin family protein
MALLKRLVANTHGFVLNCSPLLWGSCLVTGGTVLTTGSASAQLIPDATLGNESSVVTPNVDINSLASDRIDSGATRGTNLFHSFGQFNVGEGRGVYFSNPTGIERILTRVTGGNSSNILGTLGVLGNADLFLINPNGIIFGSNARLDVRGSFIAGTASSIKFADGLEFSATNPQAPPLLTINIPLGLQYDPMRGEFKCRGWGTN